MTIVESIKCVLQQNNDGLTSKQIYDEIIRQGLYSFGAENPVGVVNAQLRRRCIGLDFPTAYPIKFFEIAGYEGKKIKFRLISTENTATIITAPKTTDISELFTIKLYASEYQEKMSSVFELDGRIGAYDLKMIFPDCIKAFTNPKPVYLVHKLISFVVHDNDIVLDFFSGSATTAHAVMQLNAEDGGHRKFIMVQLPEKCDKASEAYKAGYKNICEIGKERIRRAGEKLRIDLGGDAAINLFAATDNPDLEDKLCKKFDEKMDRVKNLDVGFRVLKLDDSNMKDVYYAPDDYDQGMLAELESNIKDDRTDLDLLFGCLIDWGLPLSLPYKSEQLGGCTVHTYNDGDLIACFDTNIPESVVKEIAQRKPLRAVFRDSGFASSPEKINVFEIFKLYMPEDAGDISKRVRVI